MKKSLITNKLKEFEIQNTELIIGGCGKKRFRKSHCQPIKFCNPKPSCNPSTPIIPTTPPDVIPPGLLDD